MTLLNGKASDAHDTKTYGTPPLATDKMPYKNCNTRILSLQPVNIPVDRNTPDSTLRQMAEGAGEIVVKSGWVWQDEQAKGRGLFAFEKPSKL